VSVAIIFEEGFGVSLFWGANADADTDSAKKSPSGMLQHQHSPFTIHHSASVVLKDYKRFLEKWQSDYSMLPW